MDRNTIIGLVLIFGVFIGFSLFNSNKLQKSYDKRVEVADSLYEAGDYETAKLEYLKALEFKPGTEEAVKRVNEINSIIQPLVKDTADVKEQNAREKTEPETVTGDRQQSFKSPESDKSKEVAPTGAFADAYSGEQEFYVIKNDKVELTISTKGGRIYSALLYDYYTHDHKPLILFEGDSTVFGFQFFTRNNKRIATNDLYFRSVDNRKVIDASSSRKKAVFRLEASENEYIEYVYSLEPGKYMLDFDINFVGLGDVIASNISSLDFAWKSYIPQQEKGRQNENNYTNIKYKHFQDNVDGFRTRSQKDFEEADIPTKLKWVAFKDQFFSSVLIAGEHFSNAYVSYTKMPEDSKYLRHCMAELSLPYEAGGNDSYDMRMYFGPNNYKTLKKYDLELEELVMLGKNIIKFINKYVIVQIFSWLNNSIANYGIIILILTLIIKIVLFPLTFKSFQSQAKMKVLKPKVDELSKKYPKKEDAMKKQQATMALYKKAGSKPYGWLPSNAVANAFSVCYVQVLSYFH